MDAEAILHELTYAEGLPREALKAATAQRDEMLPLFVQQIETFLALDPGARAKPTPLFFVFHLLGEWQEKAAYEPLARLLRLPGPEVDRAAMGGVVWGTSIEQLRQFGINQISIPATTVIGASPFYRGEIFGHVL
jgi:hypothetical protein